MTARKKPSRKDMLSVCKEIHPEDGIDPRELVRKGRPRKDDRKARQLCRQVAETLSQVLSGECGDEILENLQILAVDPAPDASQLLITVQAGFLGEAIDRETVQRHIAKRWANSVAKSRQRLPVSVLRRSCSVSFDCGPIPPAAPCPNDPDGRSRPTS